MHLVLSPADYRRSAWKNGGGHTTELYAHPPHAGYDRFAFRASIADVERDGPFSAFPGVDRILLLLEGAGMTLVDPDASIDVHVPFEPLRFAGETPIDCRLDDGPTRDFNLMLRRGTARGDVDVVREAAAASPPARFHLCYVAQGDCECLASGHPPWLLHRGQTLVVDAEAAPPQALHVNPLSPGAVALVAAIDLVGVLA